MAAEITVLKNGLRIISQEYPQYETVSLGVWINTGSAYAEDALGSAPHSLDSRNMTKLTRIC